MIGLLQHQPTNQQLQHSTKKVKNNKIIRSLKANQIKNNRSS